MLVKMAQEQSARPVGPLQRGSPQINNEQKVRLNKLVMATTTNSSFRIWTGFTRGSDNDVNNLSLDTEDGLLNNPAFIKIPVAVTELATQRLALVAAMTEARKGGADRTRLKNTAKQTLVDSLMKNALYCMGEARHDLDALLSSGYEVVSKNRASGPLDTPSILALFNNVSGQLTVRGQGVLNGRMYKARTSTDGGKTWTEWGPFNGVRRMLLQPTVPGTTYMVEICALGGSTGQSPWSNPVSIMST